MTWASTFGALSEEMAGLAERVRAGVLLVRTRGGTGAATAWEAPSLGVGIAVTSNHVVGGDRALVEAGEGPALEARVVARDAARDLAVLRIEGMPPEAIPALVSRPAASLRPGELVFAVGNPWGNRGEVTAGVVLATPRAGTGGRVAAVRADIRLAPGNSGGPLVDAAGRVVGINAMVAGGLGIAVATEAVEALVADGERRPGAIGIVGAPVPLPGGGAGLLLTEVAPGSPAEAAGLIPGDVLVGVDEARDDLDAIAERLQRLAEGAPVRLDLLRGGRAHAVEVVPRAA